MPIFVVGLPPYQLGLRDNLSWIIRRFSAFYSDCKTLACGPGRVNMKIPSLNGIFCLLLANKECQGRSGSCRHILHVGTYYPAGRQLRWWDESEIRVTKAEKNESLPSSVIRYDFKFLEKILSGMSSRFESDHRPSNDNTGFFIRSICLPQDIAEEITDRSFSPDSSSGFCSPLTKKVKLGMPKVSINANWDLTVRRQLALRTWKF